MQTLIWNCASKGQRKRDENKVFEFAISARDCILELCSPLISLLLFGFILPCELQRLYNFFFIVRVRVKIKENGNYLTVAMLNNFFYRLFGKVEKNIASGGKNRDRF